MFWGKEGCEDRGRYPSWKRTGSSLVDSLCSGVTCIQWLLSLFRNWVFAHGPRGDHPAHGSFPPPNNKQVRGHMSSPTWAPVSQHRGTLETSQFSCVLGGSTSLWPKGSASILHLLAGLSCAATVSFRSTGGSREPFRSWLGSLGWLHPLELLSGTGGGASATGWEGPLDWTGSGLMGVDGCVWLLSVWWIELWLITPGKKKKICDWRSFKSPLSTQSSSIHSIWCSRHYSCKFQEIKLSFLLKTNDEVILIL